MNILDLILAIPLGWFIWKGYKQGLIYELAALAGLIIGIYIAVHFSCYVSKLLHLSGDTPVLIAFFITFIAVVALSFLVGKLIERFVKVVKMGFANNMLGAIFGMMKCVCILSVLIYYVSVIDRHEVLLTPVAKDDSILYNPINKSGNHLIGKLKVYVAEYRDKHPQDENDAN